MEFRESHSARWSSIKSSAIAVPFLCFWLFMLYKISRMYLSDLPEGLGAQIFIITIILIMMVLGVWAISSYLYLSVVSLIKGGGWEVQVSGGKLRISPPNIQLGETLTFSTREIVSINKDIYHGDGSDYIDWSITTKDGKTTNIDFNTLNPLNYKSLSNHLAKNYDIQFKKTEKG